MNRKQKCFFVLLWLLLLEVPVSGHAASFSKKAPEVTAKRKETDVILRFAKRSDLTGCKIYTTNKNGTGRKLVKTVTGSYARFENLKRGKTYYYRVRGFRQKNGKTRYTSYSKVIKVRIPLSEKQSTLKELLQTALQPVGSTMYVWGGGWNKADTAAGKSARTIGVSPKWKAFFEKQTADYDYQTTRYQIENGLDCSGYVGWCIYNILNTENGKTGYVMSASKMAQEFALRGWGKYRSADKIKNYRAGDIMSSAGHVWIVLGECSDGSVVFLHSSPPGVMISGTPSGSGNTDSEAVALARSYMKKYFPQWYKKYPDSARGMEYLTQCGQMRWDISGDAIMTDPEGYRKMSAQQILQDLFAD